MYVSRPDPSSHAGSGHVRPQKNLDVAWISLAEYNWPTRLDSRVFYSGEARTLIKMAICRHFIGLPFQCTPASQLASHTPSLQEAEGVVPKTMTQNSTGYVIKWFHVRIFIPFNSPYAIMVQQCSRPKLACARMTECATLFVITSCTENKMSNYTGLLHMLRGSKWHHY